jgi:hypothetical protein
MAEKMKKAKTPVKPRTIAASAGMSAAKKATVGKPRTVKTPSREEIALLAYQYWTKRGRQNGQHEQDWYRAEQELMGLAA